jgi:hypothetical protein
MRRRKDLKLVKADNQWMLPYWLPTQEEFLKTRGFRKYLPHTARTRVLKIFAVKGQRFPDGYRSKNGTRAEREAKEISSKAGSLDKQSR